MKSVIKSCVLFSILFTLLKQVNSCLITLERNLNELFTDGKQLLLSELDLKTEEDLPPEYRLLRLSISDDIEQKKAISQVCMARLQEIHGEAVK